MNFNHGLLLGTLISNVILVISFALAHDHGRDQCEKNLPRTQTCVKVWVPTTLK